MSSKFVKLFNRRREEARAFTAPIESTPARNLNGQLAQMAREVDQQFRAAHQQMNLAQQQLNSPRWGMMSSNIGQASIADQAFTFTTGLDIALNSDLMPIPSSSKAAVAVIDEPSRDILKRVDMANEAVQNLDLEDEDQKLAIDCERLLGYSMLRRKLRAPGTLRQVLAKLEIPILDEQSVNVYKMQMVGHYATTGKMPDPTWRLTRLADYDLEVPKFVLHKAVEITRELPEAQFYIDQLAIDPFLIVSLALLPDYPSNQYSRGLDPEIAAYVEVWGEPKFEATL